MQLVRRLVSSNSQPRGFYASLYLLTALQVRALQQSTDQQNTAYVLSVLGVSFCGFVEITVLNVVLSCVLLFYNTA